MEQIDVPVRGRELALVHPFRFEGYTGRCHVTVPVEEREGPVLILPGAFQGPRSMRAVVDRAGRHSVTVTIEPPGSTGDEVLPARFGFEWLAASVIALLDELRLDTVNIISASYATPLALCLAGLHPERVGRVVMAGATTGLEGQTGLDAARSVELIEQGQMNQFAELACAYLINQDQNVHIVRRRQVLGLMRRQLTKLSAIDAARYAENTKRVLEAPDRLAHIAPLSTPVLVYTGEHDLLTPPDAGRRLLRRIPQGVFTLIRHTDHLFFLEDPYTAVELAARFVVGRLDGPLESTTPLESAQESNLFVS